jgi:hypothetical protein
MSVALTHLHEHKGVFATTMGGGSIWYAPDATAAEPEFRLIYRVGPGASAPVFFVTPDDRFLVQPIQGVLSPGDPPPAGLAVSDYNRDYPGEHSRRVIVLDIQKLLRARTLVKCDAPPVETDENGIRAGFVVDASWPIKTERAVRTNAIATASLSSSVWLVCRKRPTTARPGYDRPVVAEMRSNITEQMRRFWDANIRGPDFLWAATGPALEAYSKHPVVLREATSSGAKEAMPVTEFLGEVRRLVVEFAVGRVLRADGSENVAAGLDDVTTYYLLHRESFGMADTPVGAAILYALPAACPVLTS